MAIGSGGWKRREVESLPVAWDDITSAFAYVSFDGGGNSAYVCRRTGAVHWHSENGDNFEELPEDIGSGDYLTLPGPRDLDLGSRLVMRFADDILPDHADTIAEIFSHRGAYGRFKDFLVRVGALDLWYHYESTATEKA